MRIDSKLIKKCLFIISIILLSLLFLWRHLYPQGDTGFNEYNEQQAREDAIEDNITIDVALEYPFLTLNSDPKVRSYNAIAADKPPSRTKKRSLKHYQQPLFEKHSPAHKLEHDLAAYHSTNETRLIKTPIGHRPLSHDNLSAASKPIKEELPLPEALQVTQETLEKGKSEPEKSSQPVLDGKQDNDNALLNGAANVAAAVGGLVYGGADLVSAATDVAVSTLGNELQRLLNKIATVNVQLNIDRNLAIKNSKLELLFPICDRENDITFLQTTLHQTDERNQGNIGLGYRFLTKEWMLGANAFLDYDFSHGHARAGVGGEYSRDFMRISVNRYIPLTGWKNSPDVLDYQERAAHGWDVRAKFWLPQLPQLGGKLIYEQYYGDEVALVSKKSRAKNPVVVTAGVTYTPFPLLEFSLDYKRSLTDDDDDTLFSVDVNYQLGVPWAQQIDPKTLNKVRSLMHSRYELVERNNNIVLEYRKQTLIIFKMAKTITAYEGNTRSLNVVQYAKYKPLTIALSGTDFITAGGKLDSASYTVTLPSYSAGGTNTYVITGLATDAKKHQEYAYATVIVKLKAARGEKSTFTPSESKILANNTDTQVLTLTVNDKNGDATDIPLEDIVIAKGGSYSSMVSSPNRTGTGTYEVTVKAGNKVEEVVLTPRVQGDNVTPATVSVTSMEPIHKDADGNVYSTFESSLESIIANDNQKSELKLTAKNEKGLAITGIKNLLSFEISKITRAATSNFTISEIAENAPGVYTASLKVAAKGNYKVIAKYRGKQIGELAVSILATEQTISSATLTPASATVIANGTSSVEFTLTIRDVEGIGIKELEGLKLISSEDGAASVDLIEDKSANAAAGTYKAKLTSSKISDANGYTVTAKSGNAELATAKLIATKQTIKTAILTPATGNVIANGVSLVEFTLTLKDNDNVAIKGESGLTLISSEEHSAEADFVEDTSANAADGTYKATLTATAPSGTTDYTVTAKKGSEELARAKLKASAKAIKTATLTPSAGTIIANGTSQTLFTLTLKDADGVGIKGETELTLVSSEDTSKVIPLVEDTAIGAVGGTYKATLTSSKISGTSGHTVTAKNGEATLATAKLIATGQTIKSATLTPASATVIANGTSKAEFTLTIKDADGVAIKGKGGLTLISSEDSKKVIPLVEDTAAGDGVYKAKLTASKASSLSGYTVTAKNGNATIEIAATTLIAKEPTINTTYSALSPATGSKVFANGVSSAPFVLVLKDDDEIPIIGWGSDLTLVSSESESAIVNFTESTPKGTYLANITASSIGNYTLTAKYKGDATGVNTAALLAVVPSSTNSSISVNKTVYDIDGSMIVTVKLFDNNNNPITGQSELISSGVTADNASLTSTNWSESDSESGTYTATYKTNLVGSGLYAKLTLSEYWSAPISSSSYSIIVPSLISIVDENSGSYSTSLPTPFPQTGFVGAKFTFALDAGSLSDYTWSSSQSWLSVNDGIVTFNSQPSSAASNVTITATPISSTQKQTLTYSFSLKDWYINYGNVTTPNKLNTDASAYCSEQGYSLPTVKQLNGSNNKTGRGARGTIGSLWAEWGSLASYTTSSFGRGSVHFSSESYRDYSYYVYTSAGGTQSDGFVTGGGTGAQTVCVVSF